MKNNMKNKKSPSSDLHQNLDDEAILYHVADMMDKGHELTDEEMALLSANDEAAHAYRELAALKHVVATPRPLDNQPEETEGQPTVQEGTPTGLTSGDGRSHDKRRVIAWLKPAIAAAAAVLALMMVYLTARSLIHSSAEGETILAYEHSEKPDGIILTSSEEQPIDLKTRKKRLTQARLTNNRGQLVLDYQTPTGNNYSISHPVQTDTIDVPYGNDFKLILADGTEVWLYADSRLVYPAQFVGDERRVFLMGEAYFRVTKDSEHPFIVSTDKMEARVLGTELNVNSRENHVALINGIVEVKGIGLTGETMCLQPGQAASLVGGRRLMIEQESMDTYVYWRNGYIYFEDATLTEIAQQLGRWFNVDVEVQNEQKQNLRLHFLYKRSDTLKRVLAILNNFGEFKAEYSNQCLRIR